MKKWIINQMDCVPKDGDLTDFVVNVHWNRNATELVNKKDTFVFAPKDALDIVIKPVGLLSVTPVDLLVD